MTFLSASLDTMSYILMEAIIASLQEILKLSDAQLVAFTADFEARLPKYIQKALHHESLAA